MAHLAEGLKECRSRVKDCPWHVHVVGTSEDKGFWVAFTTGEHRPYMGGGPDRTILAKAWCKILPEMCAERIMMLCEVRQSKREMGRPERKLFDEGHDWYNQDGRYGSYVVECSPWLLWNLLERTVDMDALNLQAVREVLER